MQHAGRKRRVTTCVPCNTRKQKCNRHYPCNQCTKRRRPEECVYNSTPGSLPSRDQPSVDKTESNSLENVLGLRKRAGFQGAADVPSITSDDSGDHPYSEHSTIAKSFGYFEDSNSNTMALLRNLDLNGDVDADMGDKSVSSYALETIKRDLERMPHRQVLDFLVQYFVSELNWMKQIIHPPSFLTRYEQWWIKDRPLAVGDVEFAVLILRICSYAANFLPSPSQTVDRVGVLTPSNIRNICSDVGDSLAQACHVLDWKGSLVRVQHILYAALKSSCEGRTDKFWEGIASASRAAQKAGIHTDSPFSGDDGAQELEKEMRRRTFCSLYVLDRCIPLETDAWENITDIHGLTSSHLSRQLDRVPFLPDNLVAETLPRLRLVPDLGDIATDASTPEMFTERLMQVQLGRFWRSFGPRRNSEYDPIQGEQRYEKFCTEYIPSLSPAFALEPDTKWDNHLPKLPMQRQLLHIAIFDSICWNFRPLLLLKPSHTASLAPYKQVLLQSQKEKIAMAAFKELNALSTLHYMFGGSHTRFAAIIFNTFEAAVLLLSLCSHTDFPFDQGEENAEILGLKFGKLTPEKSMKAAEKAIHRLHMLSEVSDMAASGARVLTQLYVKAMNGKGKGVSELENPIEPSHSSSWSSTFPDLVGVDSDSGHWLSSEHSNPGIMTEFLPTMMHEDSYPEFEIPSLDFTATMPWSTGGT